MNKNKKFQLCLYALAAVFIITLQNTSEASHFGEIHMRDGTVYRGEITVRDRLRLVTWAKDDLGESYDEDEARGGGGRERFFDIETVESFQFEPRPDLPSRDLAPERMHQRWEWKELGGSSSEKNYLGEPFPVRDLQAVVSFRGGEVLAGSLDRTAFYIYPEGQFTAKRLIIRSEERGEEGENLDDINHITKIQFLDEGRQYHTTQRITFKNPLPDSIENVWVITRETLTPLKTEPVEGEDYTIEISDIYGQGLLVAMEKEGIYHAGWRDKTDDELYQIAKQHVADVRDYYNERELLGVYDVEGSPDVLTLMKLRRRVPDRSFRERDEDGLMEFYRLAIWRWRYDYDAGRLILVERGSFFRKRLPEAGMETPPMAPMESIWIDEEMGQQENITIDGKAR